MIAVRSGCTAAARWRKRNGVSGFSMSGDSRFCGAVVGAVSSGNGVGAGLARVSARPALRRDDLRPLERCHLPPGHPTGCLPVPGVPFRSHPARRTQHRTHPAAASMRVTRRPPGGCRCQSARNAWHDQTLGTLAVAVRHRIGREFDHVMCPASGVTAGSHCRQLPPSQS